MANLLAAIGPYDLTAYFRFFDELREDGKVNMFGAAPYLCRGYRGMTIREARSVLAAWQDTFSCSLPPEDRADSAIEKSEAA